MGGRSHGAATARRRGCVRGLVPGARRTARRRDAGAALSGSLQPGLAARPLRQADRGVRERRAFRGLPRRLGRRIGSARARARRGRARSGAARAGRGLGLAGAVVRELHRGAGECARARGRSLDRARPGGSLQSALSLREHRDGEDAPVPRDPHAPGECGDLSVERAVHDRGDRCDSRRADAADSPSLPTLDERPDPRRRAVPRGQARDASRALPHARPPDVERKDGRALCGSPAGGARRARPEALLAHGLRAGRVHRAARAGNAPGDPARARRAWRRARARGLPRAARAARARLGSRSGRRFEPGRRARIPDEDGDHARARRTGARRGRAPGARPIARGDHGRDRASVRHRQGRSACPFPQAESRAAASDRDVPGADLHRRVTGRDRARLQPRSHERDVRDRCRAATNRREATTSLRARGARATRQRRTASP